MVAALDTKPTVPEGARANPADMRVHPSGKFLFVANRGHRSIATMAIDPATGVATLTASKSIPADPRNFVLDGEGKFLVIGIVAGAQVIVFAVDPATGALNQVDSKPVPNPSGVALVTLP